MTGNYFGRTECAHYSFHDDFSRKSYVTLTDKFGMRIALRSLTAKKIKSSISAAPEMSLYRYFSVELVYNYRQFGINLIVVYLTGSGISVTASAVAEAKFAYIEL